MRFFISLVLFTAVLLVHHVAAQNYYHNDAGPPGYHGGPGGSSPYGFVVPPTAKPSRPSFFRNPLAAASNLHKTVIAGIRAPAFLTNLLPSASASRPSFFSFAKPPRGVSGPSGLHPSFGPSFGPEGSVNSHYPAFFGRPGGSGGGAPPSYFNMPSSESSSSGFGGLPSNVISALQSGQYDGSPMSSSDQQEAATSLHEISGSPYDRSPPRIRPDFSSGDESEISSSSGISPALSGASSQSFDPSSYGSPASAANSLAQSLMAQQSSSGASGGAASQIAGYDIGVPVHLGFHSHSSQGGRQVSGANSVGPAYQIDTSSLQYPSGYQQQISSAQGHSGQSSYSGLATGYGAAAAAAAAAAADVGKQSSGYGQPQTYVVESSLSYDGKNPSASSSSYASSGSSRPVEYGSQGGYSGYSSGQNNEALVQALRAYANGNVKYVPGKPAVPINHQLSQSGHGTSTSYSTSSSTSSSSYASPLSSKSSKYASSGGGSPYSPPVKSATSYSSPVKSGSIRYSSNSGGLSYAESAPQAAKYGQKAASFESTRTVGSSLKFGDGSVSPSVGSSLSPSSSSSAGAGAAAAAASSSKKSS